MSSKDFVQFLKGFVTACGESGPSQDQWKTLVSILKAVEEPKSSILPQNMSKDSSTNNQSNNANPYASGQDFNWLYDYKKNINKNDR